MVVEKLSEVDNVGAEGEAESEMLKVTKQEKKTRKRKKGIYRRIVRQTEFYLSDANLRHSKFLLPLYQKDPWLPLTLFLTFNKVSAMVSEIVAADAYEDERLKELIKAFKCVESDSLVLSSCETKLNRKVPFSATTEVDVDSRTVYAENLPHDADHDVIKNIFQPFGEVVYVSIPKFNNGKSKGFAFIEFKESQSVDKVVNEFTNVTTDDSAGDLASIKAFNEENEENKAIIVGSKRKLKDGSTKVAKRVKIMEEVVSTEKVNVPHKTELQVLSKVSWKKLRNKYLNEQRSSYSAFKHSSRTTNRDRDKHTEEFPKETKSNELKIEKDLIVKITLDHEIEDVKQFKRDLKAVLDDEEVGYVDAKIGQSTAFVRCVDAVQAKRLSEASMAGTRKEVLQGKEESDYHVKAEKDKQDKRSGKVKIPKSKDKLVKRIKNVNNSHVYFE